jgi:hypothetical protein
MSTTMSQSSESVNAYMNYLVLTESEFHNLNYSILCRLSQYPSLSNINGNEILNEVVIRSRKPLANKIIEDKLAFYRGMVFNVIREMNRDNQRFFSCSPEYLEGTLTSSSATTAVEVEDEVISIDIGNFTQIQFYQVFQRLRPDQRALLELRMRDFSWREISQVLEQNHGKKIREDALRQRYLTAKTALRKEILKYCQELS